MQLIRRKDYPMLAEKANPVFLLHWRCPSYGVLCVEDLVRKDSRQYLYGNFHLIENEKDFIASKNRIQGKNIVGRSGLHWFLYEINTIYNIAKSALEVAILAAEGYVGKWAYIEKEDCYKVIALWHLQYNPETTAGRQYPFYLASRDKAAFKQIRFKTP